MIRAALTILGVLGSFFGVFLLLMAALYMGH